MSADIKALRERFAPIFARIAAGAAERERKRVLPYDEVKELLTTGFGSLRAPKELGGFGASVRQQFDLLIDLGAADSNLSQSFRPHLVFAEDQRLKAQKGVSGANEWLKKVVEGKFFWQRGYRVWRGRGGAIPHGCYARSGWLAAKRRKILRHGIALRRLYRSRRKPRRSARQRDCGGKR